VGLRVPARAARRQRRTRRECPPPGGLWRRPVVSSQRNQPRSGALVLQRRRACLALARSLSRFPLLGKKAGDFAIWRAAVTAWNVSSHGARRCRVRRSAPSTFGYFKRGPAIPDRLTPRRRMSAGALAQPQADRPATRWPAPSAPGVTPWRQPGSRPTGRGPAKRTLAQPRPQSQREPYPAYTSGPLCSARSTIAGAPSAECQPRRSSSAGAWKTRPTVPARRPSTASSQADGARCWTLYLPEKYATRGVDRP
jgi:hypothetical protein